MWGWAVGDCGVWVSVEGWDTRFLHRPRWPTSVGSVHRPGAEFWTDFLFWDMTDKG